MFERVIAGVFAGAGALILLWQGIERGEGQLITAGSMIISTMLGFFIGEKNGQRQTA